MKDINNFIFVNIAGRPFLVIIILLAVYFGNALGVSFGK